MARWEQWLTGTQEVIGHIRDIMRKRSNKWQRLHKKLQRRAAEAAFAEGFTSKLFRRMFPEHRSQASESIMVDGELVTDPKLVANGAANYFRSLSTKTDWNAPYDPAVAQTCIFPDGPWKGAQRVSQRLLDQVHSNRCSGEAITQGMSEALKPITFEQFLQDLGEGGVESSPGPSGLGYALLRCLPMGVQKLLWRMRNLIVRGQKFPSLQLDLIIVAIPKSNSPMQGYAAARPISLYEAFSKICTGSVHAKLDRLLQEHGVLHPNQFFSGRHRGVQEALQTVIHSLECVLRRGDHVVVQSCDVASAFPTVQHWALRLTLQGYRFDEKVKEFVMIADEKGHFCMRTAQAFSDWFDKPDNGVGQGEKGSPPKYTWSVDPLLWYLHEKDHVKLGLWVGDGLPKFVVINGKRAELIVCDGYLVAILFCDDLFLVSGTDENMQVLTDLVTEFHDFQGSAMAPHKCVVGSSTPAPATWLHLSCGSWTERHLLSIAREWWDGRSEKLTNQGYTGQPKYICGDGKLSVRVNTDELQMLGDPVHRKCGEKVVRGAIQPDQNSLLAYLGRAGWQGDFTVENRPIYILNVRTGTRQYLQRIAPDEAFRLLGIMLSPSLCWDKAIATLNEKMQALLSALQGSVRRKDWMLVDVLIGSEGKIGGLLRFHAGLVPIPAAYLDKWDKRLAGIVADMVGAGPGIAHDLLRDRSVLGIHMVHLRLLAAATFCKSMIAFACDEGFGGAVARRNIGEYGRSKELAIHPFAVPMHILEKLDRHRANARIDLVRAHCVWLRITIDTPQNDRSQPAPWQAVLSARPPDSKPAIQVAKLRTIVHLLAKQTGKSVQDVIVSCCQGKHIGRLDRHHRPQQAVKQLRQWRGEDGSWPQWVTKAPIPLYTEKIMGRDSSTDTCDRVIVSDATHKDGITGFACIEAGSDCIRIARCNIQDALAFEGEALGSMRCTELACQGDTDADANGLCDIGSDCMGALHRYGEALAAPLPMSRLSVERMPPVWIYAQTHAVAIEKESAVKIQRWWLRAHTQREDVIDGSWTQIQDECDVKVRACLTMEATSGEFYEFDAPLGIFDVSNGLLPGERKRVLEDIGDWLAQRSPSTHKSTQLQHPDGSWSWQAVKRIEWAAVPLRPRMTAIHFLRQKYSWDGDNITQLVCKREKRDPYRKIQQLKLMGVSGGVPYGSRLCTAKDIEDGAGRCLYCSSNALVTHAHALECAFDKISAGASVEFVDRLRKMRHLEMLRSTKVQGLTYPMPLRGWGSSDHPTHQATAQALKIEDCYSISAEHRSATLAYEVLIRQYNEKQRRRSTKGSLQKRIAKDSKLHCQSQ